MTPDQDVRADPTDVPSLTATFRVLGSDRLVVAFAGDLDVASAGAVGRLADVVHAVDAAHVELDLAAVDFVDVAGLRALVTLEQRLRSLGVEVRRGTVSHVLQRLEGLVDAAAGHHRSHGLDISVAISVAASVS